MAAAPASPPPRGHEDEESLISESRPAESCDEAGPHAARGDGAGPSPPPSPAGLGGSPPQESSYPPARLRLLQRAVKVLFGLSCATALCVYLPLATWSMVSSRSDPARVAWFVAGVFVAATLPISLYQVGGHVSNYSNPDLQRYIVRILWMVPLYAVDSWLALRFPAAAVLLDTLRDSYEAFVVYSFHAYLLTWLHQVHGDVPALVRSKGRTAVHLLPFSLILPPWTLGEAFLRNCKMGVMIYVIEKAAATAVTLVALLPEISAAGAGPNGFASTPSFQLRPASAGPAPGAAAAAAIEGSSLMSQGGGWAAWGGEGERGAMAPALHVALSVATSAAQVWALYVLLLFYTTLATELAPMHPLPKFLAIKSVVFFSFWQSAAVAALVRLQVLRPPAGHSEGAFAAALQNFVICLEMFFAALAFTAAFPEADFRDRTAPARSLWQSLAMQLDVRDVAADAGRTLGHVGGTVRLAAAGSLGLSSLGGSLSSAAVPTAAAESVERGGAVSATALGKGGVTGALGAMFAPGRAPGGARGVTIPAGRGGRRYGGPKVKKDEGREPRNHGLESGNHGLESRGGGSPGGKRAKDSSLRDSSQWDTTVRDSSQGGRGATDAGVLSSPQGLRPAGRQGGDDGGRRRVGGAVEMPPR